MTYAHMVPTLCRRVSALVFAALALTGAACSSAQQQQSAPSAPERRTTNPVIEAPEIPRVMPGTGGLPVVLDVRSQQAYAAGHVQGAVRIDHATWESDSLSDAYGLDNAAHWRARIGEMGIDGQGTVLVYDDGRMTDAARVWFILQGFGAPDVRVVNGGFPLIAEAAHMGAITLSSDPAPPRAAVFDPAPMDARRIGWIGRQELKSRVGSSGIQILDARSAGEFDGLDLRGNSRGGHLPGAMSMPHTALLDSRGRLKSPEELAALFASAGLKRGEPIITHCQGGGRAALAALAAARAGYGPVTSYYLSFGDWAKDATCPVVGP
jgi:thiosulfate/3-mercaptopyruvate sulfurtransferase